MSNQKKAKGVILAAGRGTRLRPLTEITNKMLLPIFDRPMIMGPIESLKSIGVTDICLVTNQEHVEDFKRLLGDGSKFGVKMDYAIQRNLLGIGDALLSAEGFANGSKVVLFLGDNIFEKLEIPESAFGDDYSYIFIKDVKNPESFGVAEMKDGKVINLEEKPKVPKTNHAVTGLYIYPPDVFEVVRKMKPSARGEFEITDVINYYIREGRVKAINLGGYWLDAGSFEAMLKASILRGLSISSGTLEGMDSEKLMDALNQG